MSGSIVLILLLIFVLLAVSGLFWGWIIMLIAGALGWHIAFLPSAWLLGCAASMVLG